MLKVMRAMRAMRAMWARLGRLAKGKSVAEALTLTTEQLEAALGGLPLGRKHCAGLAIEALRAGLQR